MLTGALLLSTCIKDETNDTIKPYIELNENPREYSILSNIVTIRVTATDNEGVKSITFEADGDTVGILKEEPYNFDWNTTAYPDCTTTATYITFTATAEDFAGNTRAAGRNFYVDNSGLPPVPVDWRRPTHITKHSARLWWEPSVDWEFSHYVIRRDTAGAVTITSDSIAAIDSMTVDSFVDLGTGVTAWGLDEDTDYFYKLFVYDTYGLFNSDDSVISIHTLLPQAVKLAAASPITKYSARLGWTPNEEDVNYYRLHRGVAADSASLDSIATIATGISTYLDTALTIDSTYYYYLYLFDEAGYTHPFDSTAVITVTTDSLPAPVMNPSATGITKYQARMRWATIPAQEDSTNLTLYRSNNPTVDTSDLEIFTRYSELAVTYTDRTLAQGQTYYYALRHVDSRNNIKWSDNATVTTETLAEVYTGALGVANQGKYDMEIAWGKYIYPAEVDFDRYVLERGAGNVIFTTSDATDNSFTDTGLTLRSRYSYLLTVSDTSGETLQITLDTETRDIFPARLLEVQPTYLWFYNIKWLASEEPTDEFLRYHVYRSAYEGILFVDLDGDDVPDCYPDSCADAFPHPTQDLPGETITEEDNNPNLITGSPSDLPIYWYTVLTYDQAGHYTTSNIIGDTLYAPPVAVTLSVVNYGNLKDKVELSWTEAEYPTSALADFYFDRYELWGNADPRLTVGTAESGSFLVGTVSADWRNPTFTDGTFPDSSDGTERHYTIILYDIFGQSVNSNEIPGLTQP